MAGTSPPRPFRCGSTTWSTSPAATAASNALPPCSSTASPAAEASQCVEATMPNVPASSGLVVNSGISPMTRSSHQAGARWPVYRLATGGAILDDYLLRLFGDHAVACCPGDHTLASGCQGVVPRGQHLTVTSAAWTSPHGCAPSAISTS